MSSLQKIYVYIQKQKSFVPNEDLLKEHFAKFNVQYAYFVTEDEQSAALNDFISYSNFFSTLYKEENNPLIENPSQIIDPSLAYKATVLFGGQPFTKGLNILDKLIVDQQNGVESPLNHAITTLLSPLIIPVKTPNMDLGFWRSLINGSQTKKALQLFAVSSLIADKFGLVSLGYTLGLTRTYPNIRNTKPDILYLYTLKDNSSHFGFAFKEKNTNTLIKGEVTRNLLPCSDSFRTLFDDPKWKTGERWPELNSDQQNNLFFIIQQISSKPITRPQTIIDVEDYRAKLLYPQFNKAPELALFCARFGISEHVFNRCVDLLKHPKQ
ncbi:MAG: hypothetical protein PSV35_10720, partial [bacterium]|nr:hypothetical protein [bacterium]